VAEPDADPVPITPRIAQVAVADSVAVSPPAAAPGTNTRDCSSVSWPACSTPTVHVGVPSPLGQEVNSGAEKAGDSDVATEIRTVTSSSRLTGEM
jgi:hypothetical protein